MSLETKAFLVFVFHVLCVLSQNFAGKETLIAFSRVLVMRTLDRPVGHCGNEISCRTSTFSLMFRSHNVTPV